MGLASVAFRSAAVASAAVASAAVASAAVGRIFTNPEKCTFYKENKSQSKVLSNPAACYLVLSIGLSK